MLLVGIVVAVVGLWGVGVMSPATLAGGESGPVFPFSDQSEDGQVSVSVNASTVAPGESVAVTVSVDRRPRSDATVVVAGESYTTDADGTVVVSLSDPGTYDVEGTDPDGNRTATTTVRVQRYETELVVSTPAGVVTNESVPVRVERADGGVVSATVSVAGLTVETGADGVANVTFDTAGQYEVRASRSPTERYRFVDGTATVAVDRRPVRLHVGVNESAPRVDAPVAVSVTRRDTGRAVNATLSVGNRSVVTGADGVANLTFAEAGGVAVGARANRTPAVRYLDGEAYVEVKRIPVSLSVTVSPTPVPEGERAQFVVRRTDTGERVAGNVSLFGTTYATGPDGRVSFPFYAPGDATVRATKASTARERYRPAESTFRVEGPEVVLESLSVPASALANDTMRVNATLSNVGTADVAGDAVVVVGSRTTRVPTSVAAGETTTVSWRVRTPNATGNVSVEIAYEEVRATRPVELRRADPNESAPTNGSATPSHSSVALDRSTESEPVATSESTATSGPVLGPPGKRVRSAPGDRLARRSY